MGDTVSQEGVEGGRRSQKWREGLYLTQVFSPNPPLSAELCCADRLEGQGQAGKGHYIHARYGDPENVSSKAPR